MSPDENDAYDFGAYARRSTFPLDSCPNYPVEQSFLKEAWERGWREFDSMSVEDVSRLVARKTGV